MGKEMVLKYSNTAGWNRARKVLLLFFWLCWATLLGSVIYLTVTHPRYTRTNIHFCDICPCLNSKKENLTVTAHALRSPVSEKTWMLLQCPSESLHRDKKMYSNRLNYDWQWACVGNTGMNSKLWSTRVIHFVNLPNNTPFNPALYHKKCNTFLWKSPPNILGI